MQFGFYIRQKFKMSKVKSFICIGQVMKNAKRKGTALAKVRIPKMKLDKNLLMYFPNKKDVWCADNGVKSRPGDIVVLSNFDGDIHGISHGIDSVLYKSGAVRDPVTGRLCRGTQFVNEDARKDEQENRVYKEIKVTKRVEVL